MAATEYEPVPDVTEEESETSEAFDDPGVGESDVDDMRSDDRRPFDLRVSSMSVWSGSLLSLTAATITGSDAGRAAANICRRSRQQDDSGVTAVNSCAALLHATRGVTVV